MYMETIKGTLIRKINLRNLRDLVWRNASISMPAKVILLDLIFYAGVKGDAFPSHKTLAKNQDISTRYIRKILKELKSANWIDWRKYGFSTTNSYGISTELLTLLDIELEDNVEQVPIRNNSSARVGTPVPEVSGTDVPANKSHVKKRITNKEV